MHQQPTNNTFHEINNLQEIDVKVEDIRIGHYIYIEDNNNQRHVCKVLALQKMSPGKHCAGNRILLKSQSVQTGETIEVCYHTRIQDWYDFPPRYITVPVYSENPTKLEYQFTDYDENLDEEIYVFECVDKDDTIGDEIKLQISKIKKEFKEELQLAVRRLDQSAIQHLWIYVVTGLAQDKSLILANLERSILRVETDEQQRM
jgi:hypothetical protein